MTPNISIAMPIMNSIIQNFSCYNEGNKLEKIIIFFLQKYSGLLPQMIKLTRMQLLKKVSSWLKAEMVVTLYTLQYSIMSGFLQNFTQFAIAVVHMVHGEADEGSLAFVEVLACWYLRQSVGHRVE